MLHNSSGMGQYYITNTYKSGVLESIWSMCVLQDIIWIIDQIKNTSWDMKLLKELFSTVNYTRLTIYKNPIILDLMNITILYKYKTSMLLVLYYFNRNHKVLFRIRIWLTRFHATLILHWLNFVMQPLLNMKFSYPMMEKKLVSIYCMKMNLPSHIILIQFWTYQLVINFQHRLRRMCVSFILMGKNQLQKKGHLMDYTTIKVNVENLR